MTSKRNVWTVAAATFLAFLATILVVDGANPALGADAAKMKPFLVASSAGNDAVWDAIERVAKEMKFQDVVQGTRAIYGQIAGLDRSKPFGFVGATDGDAVVGFAFLPISSLDELAVPGVDGLKEKIVKTDEGTFYGEDKKIELLEKDGWLFVFEAKSKESIPTTDPTAWLGETSEKAPLTIDVDFATIPEEFLEATFATLRMQAAQTGGALAMAGNDAAEAQIKQFNEILHYYSDIVASLQRVVWTLNVDEATGSIVVDKSATCKNGSPLQETLAATQTGETRWGAMRDFDDAVFTVACAGKYSKRDREFLADYYRANFFENIAKQLETSLDDDETLSSAKEIVAAFEASILCGLDDGAFDVGEAFVGGERPLFAFGLKIAKPDEFRNGVRLLFDSVRKASADAKNDFDFDQFVKLDAATIDGFSVSTVDIPFETIGELDKSANVAPYFADKTLAARFGIKDDSVLFVLGLDAAQADAEFARIAAGTATPTKNATDASFAFAPLGRFLAVAFDGAKNVDPSALQTFKRIAEADGARLNVETAIDGARVEVEYVATAELFQLAGDLIRLQLFDGGKVDDSKELDDVFDEE